MLGWCMIFTGRSRRFGKASAHATSPAGGGSGSRTGGKPSPAADTRQLARLRNIGRSSRRGDSVGRCSAEERRPCLVPPRIRPQRHQQSSPTDVLHTPARHAVARSSISGEAERNEGDKMRRKIAYFPPVVLRPAKTWRL